MHTAALAAIFLVVACAAPAPVPMPVYAPPPAAPAPASALDRVLAAPDLDGRPVGRDPQARATVLVVFASWCDRCREQLAMITALAAERPSLRVIGINVREHEEYDGRGDAAAVRAYAAAYAPILRVVPAGDDLFDALGRPAKVPTLYVYDGGGALIEVYDRRVRTSPDRAELSALLDRLGA